MKIYCDKCKSYAVPTKVNNNLFAIRAKCGSCGREIDVMADKNLKMGLAILRVMCYLVDFKTFLLYVPVIVIPVLALYWILAEIIVFRIK